MQRLQSRTELPNESERGSSLIETALVVPLLMLLLVGSIDLGRACTIAIAVQSAAHAGALYGTMHPTDTAGMVAAANADSADWAVVQSTATYDCRCSDGSSVQSNCSIEPIGCLDNSVYNVQVSTSASFNPLFQLAGFTNFTIQRQVNLRASR